MRFGLVRGTGLLIAAFAGALSPLAACAETRAALVIGNSAYSVRPLTNPKNDATLISETLKGVGFEVATVIDGSQAQMKAAVLEFGRRLNAPDTVGVFYYAGHGVQVDGENYLIPVGADIRDLEEVALNAVNLSEILKTMERANSRLNLAILDACRDNPFASRTRSGTSGLAEVDAPSGTMIAYATAPGRVALDGTGANSPYTAALAEAIHAEGAALEDVFRRTRRKVLEVTSNRQTPWEHSSLTGEFFFRIKTASPEATLREPNLPAQDQDQRLREITAWDAIKGSTDAADLERHAEAFPEGLFSELVAMRLEKLKRPEPPPWPWQVTETAALPGVSEAEGLYEEALKLDGPVATAADMTAAATLYAKAADLGLPAAMYALGRSYDKGRGQTRNAAQAYQWYRAAANAGHAGAMSSLGTMYEYGEGTAADLAEAFRLYQLAADRGDASAMCSLAYLYASGKGVTRNSSEARRWYAQSAGLNHPRAAFNLALMTMKGEGGVMDLTEAVRLLNAAAAHGHAGALRELAALYDTGRGVVRNPALAADHFLRAVRAADKKARAGMLDDQTKLSVSLRQSVQRELAAQGYYQGRATGRFDAATRRALDRFAARA